MTLAKCPMHDMLAAPPCADLLKIAYLAMHALAIATLLRIANIDS